MKIVAHVHTHPNSRNPPSPQDVVSTSGDTKQGYNNVVVNKTGIVFYYSSNSQMPNVTNNDGDSYGNKNSFMYTNIAETLLGPETVSHNYNIIFDKSNMKNKTSSHTKSNTKKNVPSSNPKFR